MHISTIEIIVTWSDQYSCSSEIFCILCTHNLSVSGGKNKLTCWKRLKRLDLLLWRLAYSDRCLVFGTILEVLPGSHQPVKILSQSLLEILYSGLNRWNYLYSRGEWNNLVAAEIKSTYKSHLIKGSVHLSVLLNFSIFAGKHFPSCQYAQNHRRRCWAAAQSAKTS